MPGTWTPGNHSGNVVMDNTDDLFVEHIDELRARVDEIASIPGLDDTVITSPDSGDFLLYDGANWVNSPFDSDYIASSGGSPFVKGDLIASDIAGVLKRMGIGANGQVLAADSAQTLGMHWVTPASSGASTRIYDCVVGATDSDYTSIGAAYTAGKRTMFVKIGTYNESSLVVGADDVTLFGESRTKTIINIGNNTWEFAALRSDIRNLSITVGGTGKFLVTGKYNTIISNNINISPTGTDPAIDVDSGSQYNLISGNYIVDTGTTSMGSKISIQGDRNLCTGNFFKINPTIVSTGGAITVLDLNNFIANYVYANTTGTGPFVRTGGVNMIVGNFINGRTDQVSNISLECTGILATSTSQHTQIKDNNIYNCYDAAIRLNQTGESQIHHNFLDYSDIGIDCISISDCQITGNFSAYQTTKGSSVKIGIRMQACFDNLVSNNYIVNYDPNIYLDGSCVRNTIVYNRMNIVTTDISDNGYATHIEHNKPGHHSNNKIQAKYKNTSGGTLDTGTVVVLKSVAGGDEIATTTTGDDPKVIGVVSEINIGNNAWGYIQVEGKFSQVKVNGTNDIAIGDFLSTYSVAGIAGKAASGATAFAIALGAYTGNDSNGLISCLLIQPRKI